jgi:WD40 repeat protein
VPRTGCCCTRTARSRRCLRSAPSLDRQATRALIARLYPAHRITEIDDGNAVSEERSRAQSPRQSPTVAEPGYPGQRQLVQVITGLDDQVYKMAFSIDGRTLVTIGGARSSVATLWDAASGQQKGHVDGVVPADGVGAYRVAISPSGDRIAVGGSAGTVRVFNVANGQNTSTIRTVGNVATSVAFSPDGQTVAFGDTTSVGLASGSPTEAPRFLDGADGCGYSVAFTPDGKTLAAGCHDGTLRLWNLAR